MICKYHLLLISNPFLDLWNQEITLMITLNYRRSCLFCFVFEKIQHDLFFLQCFLSSSQLDAWVGTLLKNVKWTIQFNRLSCNRLIDSIKDYIPVNIFIILKYFDLYCFLCNFVLYIFSFKLIQNRSNSFLQTSRFI